MKMTISRICVGAVLAAMMGFRVAAEVALPSDYTALEWIASTGTQFIDTGYTHGANVRVECEISATAVGSYACVFGSRAGGFGKTDNALGFFVRWNNGNRPTLEYGSAGKTVESIVFGTDNTFPYGERVSIVYENKTVTWVGQTKSGSITSTLARSPAGLNPMLIFDTNSGPAGTVKNEANLTTMRLYSFAIREGGALKRDFVPCRNAWGEVGLWDKVEGRFHGNIGKGVLLGSDRILCRVNYIRSTGTQYIDTGYTHAANVRIECEAAVTAVGDYACVFGSRAGGWTKSQNALSFFVRWVGANMPDFEYGSAGKANIAGTVDSFPYDERVMIVYENKTITWTGVTKSGSLSSPSVATPAGLNTMLLFDVNSGAAGMVKNEGNFATMKLYSFKALENGVAKCDIVPARTADGKVGVLNLADTSGNAFRPNLGTGDFTYGYAYEPTATGVTIYDGVVEAADGLETVAVAKAGRDSLTIAAPAFASLAVREGEAKFTGETTVGALTLTGGARLAYDVTGDGNGCVNASSVAFAEVTAERPVQVAANLLGIASLSTARVLIAGAQLTVGDLAKFRLCGTAWPVRLEILDGNLVLVPVEGAYLNYAASDGRQKVKLDYAMDADTTMKFSFGHPVYQAETALFGLSWNSSCYLLVQQSDLFCFYGSGVQLTSVGKPDVNARYSFEVGDDNVVSLRKENTSLSVSTLDSRSVAKSTSDLYLSIFACNADHPSAYRFYSMEIGKGGGSPRTVTPQRRLLPYRNENGLVGLKDEISGTFYPNTGTAALSYGYAFNRFEGGVTIYDGVVDAEDALASENIVKEGTLALNLGVLTQVASLNVRAGEVGLVDETARTLTVVGRLKLAGGARLSFDVLPGGSDSITASAIDLAGVTAENPVTLKLVMKGGGTFSETGALVLLSGGLVAGDEAKFRVEGLPADLSVSNGSLVATFPDDIPYTAEWIGEGDRMYIDDTANWRCLNFAGKPIWGMLPKTPSAIVIGTNTTFCCPFGQTLYRREFVVEDEVTLAADCDWRGLDLPIDFKINLHGHKLYLSRLDGKGTITDDATGYQRLEYISSTGTQYIDTGYKHASNVRIECEASVVEAGNYACIFGSRTGGWSKSDTALGFFVRWNKANVPNLEYGGAGKTGGNIAGTAGTFPFDERVMIVYENKTVTWTGLSKSGSLSSNWSSMPAGQNTMLLFDTNSGAANAVKNETNYATMQLYSFKALEDGEVVCHLVPVRRRSDGAVGVLDLANGNTFHGSLGTGSLTAGPVVAAEGAFAAGELHLDVPADVTVDNSTLALTGSLKLVKEGEGTFNPLADNQTYCGGTDLRAGSVTVNAQGPNRRFGAVGSEIRIGAGTTLDMAAFYDYYDYSFVLAGGTLKNSKALAKDWDYAMVSSVRVTEENARLDFNQYGVLGWYYRPTILDLQGHRLDAYFQGYCYFVNTYATKGTLAIHGPVEFWHGSFLGTETTLDIDGKLALNAVDVHVGTYIARSTTNACSYNGNLYVYQRFVPLTDNFWGCVLKNGAVLDLSTRTDVWNTTGALVSNESTFTKKTVVFEKGAVIGVDVGKRRLRDGLKLAAWTEKPDATFKLLDCTAYKLKPTTEGLVCVSNGTIMFLR